MPPMRIVPAAPDSQNYFYQNCRNPARLSYDAQRISKIQFASYFEFNYRPHSYMSSISQRRSTKKTLFSIFVDLYINIGHFYYFEVI